MKKSAPLYVGGDSLLQTKCSVAPREGRVSRNLYKINEARFFGYRRAPRGACE